MTRKSRNRPQKGGVSPRFGGENGGSGVALASGDAQVDLRGEFAVRPMLLQASDLDGLPNPDPILRAEGRSLAVYRTMVDDHLTSVMSKRYAAVSARSWTLERGKASARAVKILQDALDSINMRQVIRDALKAVGYGYSVQEVVWDATSSGMIVPSRIIERPQEWFRFGLRGETRFVDDAGMLPVVPDRKLLICRHEPDALNPYGSPVLSRCFWPLATKHGNVKLWMMFGERFGLPKTVARVPQGMSDRDRAAMAASLESLVRAGVAVLTENGRVELLETKTSGDLPFPGMIQWANSAMSKAWLGEVASTEVVGTGSYGYAKAGIEVRADLALDDAAMVESQALNTLVRWFWEINGLGSELPWIQIDMPEDLQMGRIKRDLGLRSLGARFTPLYFQEIYNIAPEYLAGVDNASPTSAAEVGAFGAPEGSNSREAIFAQLESALQDTVLEGQADKLVQPIIDMASKGTKLDDMTAVLASMVESDAFDTSDFEDALARICTLAEGIGRGTDA